MNSRNGHKVHEGGKILACAESVVTCMDVVRGSSASGLIFLLPRILPGATNPIIGNVMRSFSGADSVCQ